MPAFEEYNLSRQRACYKSPLLHCPPEPTPSCAPDQYTQFFRKRWEVLEANACKGKKKGSGGGKALCPSLLLDQGATPSATKVLKQGRDWEEEEADICHLPAFQEHCSDYKRDFRDPIVHSHNNLDDCCSARCPCAPSRQRSSPQEIGLECTLPRSPFPPLDDRTTYTCDYPPKPVPNPPAPRHRPSPWDPCSCPIEGATSYRLDYPHKRVLGKGGPVPAATTHHGLWSMDQFSPEALSSETETGEQFRARSDALVARRRPILPVPNLSSGPPSRPFPRASETCTQFGAKWEPSPCIPEWVLREPVWVPPCPPLQHCTTYNSFFCPPPDPPQQCPGDFTVRSPKAIPFSTTNGIWPTCCEPPVGKPASPVEIRDDDPWPWVKPEPIKYQDSLLPDPCAPFRDETTYKADYLGGTGCGRKNGGRRVEQGYVRPMQPFLDDTTARVSFPAYSATQYKEAKQKPGNPSGKYWGGPFKCPSSVDKCLPRFPSPYGNPLKPFTKQCPCGPFDDRSTYHNDFKYKVGIAAEDEEEGGGCLRVPRGASLYRFDYVGAKGEKSRKSRPPDNRGHRAIQPAPAYRELDTLYRLQFKNFAAETYPLQLYRGRREDAVAVERREQEANERRRMADMEPYEIRASPPGTTVQDVLEEWERKNKYCT